MYPMRMQVALASCHRRFHVHGANHVMWRGRGSVMGLSSFATPSMRQQTPTPHSAGCRLQKKRGCCSEVPSTARMAMPRCRSRPWKSRLTAGSADVPSSDVYPSPPRYAENAGRVNRGILEPRRSQACFLVTLRVWQHQNGLIRLGSQILRAV